MSWYINYYLGYRDKNDGKIYPLGPYTYDNPRIHCVFYKSRVSQLKEEYDFCNLNDDEISQDLKDAFPEEFDDDGYSVPMQVLNAKNLGSSDYIKTGYFLTKEIQEYNKYKEDGEYFEGFYERLTPLEYAEKLKADMLRPYPPEPQLDIEGEPMPVYTAFDYSYFAYPDYDSVEYEVHMLRLAIFMFDLYNYTTNEGNEIVILKTEG